MKVELSATANPLHRGPAVARRASSEFIAKINDDRFLLRKLPSPNVTTIYLISVVLSQARHCSVKSHPFPSLSPLPSSVVLRRPCEYVLPLSLSPSVLPRFIHIILSSLHELVFARPVAAAARRLLSARREPYCHLLVHNMSTGAFADRFVVAAMTRKGNTGWCISYFVLSFTPPAPFVACIFITFFATRETPHFARKRSLNDGLF